MVFSSINPIYLDPPNWHHQQSNQQIGGTGNENLQLPPPPPPGGVGGGVSGGSVTTTTVSVKPGSMAERARLAKIPQPEIALKCPRCESANTKFCYFNNYSLSQPRHYCKTCRRYWTRGGALRNVPVGGGCRRNKRSKGSNRSKSPSKVGSSSSNGLNNCTSDIIGHLPPPPPPHHLPILPPLHHLSDYNFNGIQPPVTGSGGCMEFHTSSTGVGSILSSGLVDQWRLQQVQNFPFLTSLEASANNGLYQFEGADNNQNQIEAANYVGQIRSKPWESGICHQSSVKMEENQHQRLNLSKNFLGISANDHQYNWSANNTTTATNNNAWTDLSGFTSSSATHLL